MSQQTWFVCNVDYESLHVLDYESSMEVVSREPIIVLNWCFRGYFTRNLELTTSQALYRKHDCCSNNLCLDLRLQGWQVHIHKSTNACHE